MWPWKQPIIHAYVTRLPHGVMVHVIEATGPRSGRSWAIVL
jgi:hypothetical protein